LAHSASSVSFPFDRPAQMKHPSASRENDRLFRAANAAWDRGDLRLAFDLFSRAAEAGDRFSQLDLGYFFDTGLYVRKDKEEALRWYHKAYRQGEASAANNIATVHRDSGELRKMIWWFRRAAALGEDDTFFELGRCYEMGLGVRKNFDTAKRLYRRVLRSRDVVVENTRVQAGKRLARLEGLATKAEPGGCTSRRKSSFRGNSGPPARRQ
jgi:TPR repeat protein